MTAVPNKWHSQWKHKKIKIKNKTKKKQRKKSNTVAFNWSSILLSSNIDSKQAQSVRNEFILNKNVY